MVADEVLYQVRKVRSAQKASMLASLIHIVIDYISHLAEKRERECRG